MMPRGFEYMVFCFLAISAAAILFNVAMIWWCVRRLNNAVQRGSFAGKPVCLFAAALIPTAVLMTLEYIICPWSEIRIKDPLWLTLMAYAAFSAAAGVWLLLKVERPQLDVQKVSRQIPVLWLQDLLIAVIGSGVWLTLSHAFSRSTPIYISATAQIEYLFAASAGSLALSIDLSRSSTLGQRPAARAGIFGFVFALVPPLSPAIALTWVMWRIARKRAARAQANLQERNYTRTLESGASQQATKQIRRESW